MKISNGIAVKNQMMITEEEKALIPLKEKRANNIFLYVIEDVRVNVMTFFDKSGMNVQAKLIIRPSGAKKFVTELAGADWNEGANICKQLTYMLQQANIYDFTDSFYQKICLLTARWLKLIELLNALARVRTKNAEYLDALCNVFGLSDSRNKEADCTKLLTDCLSTYEEICSVFTEAH